MTKMAEQMFLQNQQEKRHNLHLTRIASKSIHKVRRNRLTGPEKMTRLKKNYKKHGVLSGKRANSDEVGHKVSELVRGGAK